MNTKKEHHNKRRVKIGQIGLHIFFILFCATYILPFILIISVSFSDENALKTSGFSLIPKIFSTAAYELAFKNASQLLRAYEVTIIFSIATTALVILFSGMMAYAMSRPNYRFRNLITFMAFFTMLFSGGLVPSYIINTRYLHLGNSMLIYILPSIISAWNLIVIRTNFQQIPSSLFESAKLDGASEFRICFQIVFPLSLPVLATIGFLTFVGKWNDWFTTSVYIRSLDLYSLQFLLQRILRDLNFVKQMEQMVGDTGLLNKDTLPTESFRFAMAVLAAGPVLVMFPLFQKYFSKGLTIGAVKG